MILTIIITALAVAAAFVMPLRWGWTGYLGVAALLFTAQVAAHTGMGFDGTSIEESLLLFNGSWGAYLSFNLQITYRAFSLPLVALAVPLIWRLSRGRE